MADKRNSRLFVYGTLLQATGRPDIDAVLRDWTRDLGAAQMSGKLFSVGAYPAAVCDGDTEGLGHGPKVLGHLFEILDPDKVWPVLDAYEDFDVRDPAASEFLPLPIQVGWNDMSTEAITYAYNRSVAGLEPIPSGDWLAWRLQNGGKGSQLDIPAHGIAPHQADGLIARYPTRYGIDKVTLAEASGRVLAEDLFADRDWPPYDRVAMDGIAVAASAWESGLRRFRISGSQYAGAPRQTLGDAEGCLMAMTGAILPAGCDRVIRIEDVSLGEKESAGYAAVKASAEASAFKNIHRRGSDRKAGDQVLTKGQILRAPEAGIIASLGLSEVAVYRRPRVALVTTGDELVPVGATPLEHQVRQSNGPALQAALRLEGIDVAWTHVSDDAATLQRGLVAALEACDILLVTGGVSMGERDLVPAALSAIGVSEVFHKLKQKPGKPIWFGVAAGHEAENTSRLVFALPGNPVSVLVCFRRYVLPALRRSMGHAQVTHPKATLGRPWKRGPKGFTVFAPCKVSFDQDGRLLAHPVANQGSGDFAALQGTDGFIALESDKVSDTGAEAGSETHFPVGSVGDFYPWA
jgi:molybdopterin molybdotransferase